MSDILFLARDYIERMTNPVYGASTNEDYAIRFATLLRSEGFEARLNEEIRDLTDQSTLTSHGWLWLFGWARSRNIELKEDLLVALYEEWSSVFVRTSIVDLATQNVDYRSQGVSVEEFPNTFLARIMTRATRRTETEAPRDPEKEGERTWEEQTIPEPKPSTALAESTLIALLQVRKPITIDAARVLLRHTWEGQEQLLKSFWGICNSLEPETQRVWIERLRPPPSEARRE